MRIPLPILFLYAVGIALGALAGLNYAVMSALGLERFDFLRLGVEANLPSWYSTVQLFVVALVFGLIGWRDAVWRSPRTWPAAFPGLFFLLLSLDEGAQVHERLGWLVEAQTGLGSSLLTGAWLFIAVPLYAVLMLVSARALWPYFRGRKRVLALGAAGCVLFIVSAAGFEALGNLTDPANESARRVLGVFEEVGEMVAATTLLWSGLTLAHAEGFRLVSLPPFRPLTPQRLPEPHSDGSRAGEPLVALSDPSRGDVGF